MNTVTLLLSTNTFLSVLTKIGTIVLAILVLLFMITVHEFGHYTFGKIFKFKIYEFSIGFGKALYTKTHKNGEKFSIRLLPLGGYCAFGEDDIHDDDPTSFNNQAPWKRLIVLFGGVLFNFLSAIIFAVILLAVIGNGHELNVHSVVGPNADYIYENDIIVEVDDTTPSFLNGGLASITRNVGLDEPVTIVVLRDGQRVTLQLEKQEFSTTDEVTGEVTTYNAFGIVAGTIPLSFGQALLQSVPWSFEVAWECLVILGQLITGQYGISEVGGPITTISVIADASAVSLNYLLLFIPLISINLAVFNLLPIPALDGARMVFVGIEWIRKKPINREIEAKIHTVGLIVLFCFVILIDILHLILT